MTAVGAAEPFRWQDGERLIVFGRGSLGAIQELLDRPYVLLTTSRAASQGPALVSGATAVHEVPSGRVDELAAGLRERVEGELLVALGGGRVIDVAKALAAADPPRRVAAIPTTLSGAEMTSVHRHAAGIPLETPRARPAIVVNDPAMSASAPLRSLAASAANAFGHAAEGPLTPLSNPVATLAAHHSARMIAACLPPRAPALDFDGQDTLALAALLAGYVIGSTGYGLHHVVAQTLARYAGVPHGVANAVMLPVSLVALERRFPSGIAVLGEALGAPPPDFASRLCELTGVVRLRDAEVSEDELERCAEAAAARPELHLTPPPADRNELRELYAAAY